MLPQVNSDPQAVLDKCKHNIMTWMEINDDWRSRCTEEKMERYKSFDRTSLDADVVFNNPAVAIEVGLVDVVRHLVEEKKVDVNAPSSLAYRGLSREVGGLHLVAKALVEKAVLRGDVSMVRYIMSLDGFKIGSTPAQRLRFFNLVVASPIIRLECFKLFLQLLLECAEIHLSFLCTSVDQLRPPLLHSLFLLHSLSLLHRDTKCAAIYYEKANAMLDAGADPFADPGPDIERRAPIEFAKCTLEVLKLQQRMADTWPLWTQLIEKMEARKRSSE